ncbi:hypothetical protein CEXT_696121 [Caerostris extrusa]|uniref:Uncharacterized protein n=1 Tax=Caerostris extrusa TaxID=172846 RepID=A0AAV4XH58_CAEEX|nr:hypothetical protein CEXT_696121 [Caerostris extrusa]
MEGAKFPITIFKVPTIGFTNHECIAIFCTHSNQALAKLRNEITFSIPKSKCLGMLSNTVTRFHQRLTKAITTRRLVASTSLHHFSNVDECSRTVTRFHQRLNYSNNNTSTSSYSPDCLRATAPVCVDTELARIYSPGLASPERSSIRSHESTPRTIQGRQQTISSLEGMDQK